MDKQVRERPLPRGSARSEAGGPAGGGRARGAEGVGVDGVRGSEEVGTSVGRKFDRDKLRYDLVDDDAEAEFVAVLTFGAIKYEPGDWARVEDAQARYFAAVRRHLRSFRRGEVYDPETGLHHLAAAACCVHFMLGIAMREDPEIVASFAERFAAALSTARAIRAAR